MKKLLIYAVALFIISCGGDTFSNNCGDGILQKDEACEIGMTTDCRELGFDSAPYIIYCTDVCDGYDVTKCMEE